MSQRRGLGRGLGALISNPNRTGQTAPRRPSEPSASEARARTRASEAGEDRRATLDRVASKLDGRQDERPDSGPRGPEELDLALIDPNPEQPRREFDPVALDQLARSIGQHGVLQPVVVRRAGDRYELVMGERRFRASQRAGRRSIPAVVLDVAPADRLELAIVENVQRQDLNPIELAHAYQALSEAGHTQEEIGRKVAMDRSSVANHLRLLDLSRTIQTDVENARLSMGHAKALLQVEDLEAREALSARVQRESLSVRATEQLAREANGGGRKSARSANRPKAAAPVLDADTRAYVERIERRLQTKVSLHPNSDGGGKIEVNYFDLEDLERIGAMLLGESALAGS